MQQQLIVQSFQNTKIQLNIGIVGWRILAFSIDFFILIAYFFAILFSIIYVATGTFNIDSLGDEKVLNFLLMLIFLPLYFYSLWTEFLFNGQTFGKMICGIKVIKINGYQCTFIEYLLRWLFRMIDIYPVMILSVFFGEFGSVGTMLIGIPALISAAITKKGQRLGDIVAGTTVVKLKDRKDISITILKEVEQTYQPKFPNVIKLSDNDMRIIKDTFTISRQNRDYNTIGKLRKKIEEVTEIKSNLTDVEFIDIVIKDFNYYTQEMK